MIASPPAPVHPITRAGRARASRGNGALPATADVVIVGAGVLGCSIAWHLSLRRPDLRVVVIDRQEGVATQASAQAAGLLTRARTDAAAMALVARPYDAIEKLGDELGEPPVLQRSGTLHVASANEAVRALEALAGAGVAAGLQVERRGPSELRRLVSWLNPEPVRSAAFMPEDAFVDPYLLADAYHRAARRRGALFRFGIDVLELIAKPGLVGAVMTGVGPLHAPRVVVAAGAWANRLTLPLGFGLAMAPVRSHYWLTVADERFPRGEPTVVMPDARAYARPELGALLFGLRERQGTSVDPRDLPRDMSGYAFADDPGGWASLAAGAPALLRYCPAIGSVGIRGYVAGASTYTPDGLFLAGPVPGIDGLFVAGGCCGAGVAASGGLGELMAAMALGEAPRIDAAPFALDRFGDRFGPVDPSDPGFRARCVATRSGKSGG